MSAISGGSTSTTPPRWPWRKTIWSVVERLHRRALAEQEGVGDDPQRSHVNVRRLRRDQPGEAVVDRGIFPRPFCGDRLAIDRQLASAFAEQDRLARGDDFDRPGLALGS